MIPVKTRKEIYEKYIAPMLCSPHIEQQTLTHGPNLKVSIKLDYTNALKAYQGFNKLHLIRGELDIINGQNEHYVFFIKYAENGESDANAHIKTCTNYIDWEVNRFDLDGIIRENMGITPLSVVGNSDKLGDYILTEAAGDRLSAVFEKEAIDDPNIISAVANNIFAVSKNTLDNYFAKDYRYNSQKVHFIDQTELIRQRDTKFFEGVQRLFNQALGKYKTTISELEELAKEVAEKRKIAAGNEEIESIDKRLAEDIARGATAIANLEKLKACTDYTLDALKGLPIIFLPTEMFDRVPDHIRLKTKEEAEGTKKYRAHTIDNAVFPDESSAGCPLEAHEKLTNAAGTLKTSERTVANVAHFLGYVAEIIKKEFLEPDSPIKYWQESDKKLQKLLTAWRSSLMYQEAIRKSCIELRYRLTTMPQPEPQLQSQALLIPQTTSLMLPEKSASESGKEPPNPIQL